MLPVRAASRFFFRGVLAATDAVHTATQQLFSLLPHFTFVKKKKAVLVTCEKTWKTLFKTTEVGEGD